MDDSDIWSGIEAAGPLLESSTFDPLLVDNVIWAERSAAEYDRRRAFVASYAWAVPTKQAIRQTCAFVGGRKLLEVCAGTGLWARLLSSAGTSVVATDGAPELQADWFTVEFANAEDAVRSHPQCQALLLCWPPFKDACAFRALQSFEGDLAIYIGDIRFTADIQFHSLLLRSWELIQGIPLPSWPGIEDGVHLYVRK
ncbi:MAG TPA: hypothetical protein VJB57_16400 [Dehalococcoidia bacterium]|nr:hypothetical protein [Dehalococcoidia bacterium]